jgi:hypothetical protein
MSNSDQMKWADFETIELEMIQKAMDSNDENIDAVIKNFLAKYEMDGPGEFKFPGVIYSTSDEDLFDEIKKCIPFLFPNNNDIANEIDSVMSSENSSSMKWHLALQTISNKLIDNGGAIISALTPNGGSDYVFLVFPDKSQLKTMMLFYHFSDTWNNAAGWFDEYIQDFNIPYSDYLNKLNTTETKISSKYEFSVVHDEIFGDRLEGNARSISLTEEIFTSAIQGMTAAKKYC